MIRLFKKLFVLVSLFCLVNIAWADRGTGKKSKTKVALNIVTPSSLRNSISFNLKTGLTYTGSLLASQQTIGSAIMNNSLITYEKGNTIYIIPYKHQVIMPDIRPGYSGIKIMLHSR